MARQRDYQAEYIRRQALGRIRGYSKQRARGHAGTAERPVPLHQEYQVKKARAQLKRETERAAGGEALSLADRRFLDKQEARAYSTKTIDVEDRWENARAYYVSATFAERDSIRREQSKMDRRYRGNGRFRSRGHQYADPTFWIHVPRLSDDDKALLFFYH